MNGIQKSINQIGMDGVIRYLPKGMRLHPCDIHGYYLAHYKNTNPVCPLCSMPTQTGEGVTATQVEKEIDERMAPPTIPVYINL